MFQKIVLIFFNDPHVAQWMILLIAQYFLVKGILKFTLTFFVGVRHIVYVFDDWIIMIAELTSYMMMLLENLFFKIYGSTVFLRLYY